MAIIHLIDIYGTEHTIEGHVGRKLMESLREHEFGVIASCGGMCSCATCHVYVDAAWLANCRRCSRTSASCCRSS